jgi:hypothetical protein
METKPCVLWPQEKVQSSLYIFIDLAALSLAKDLNSRRGKEGDG